MCHSMWAATGSGRAGVYWDAEGSVTARLCAVTAGNGRGSRWSASATRASLRAGGRAARAPRLRAGPLFWSDSESTRSGGPAGCQWRGIHDRQIMIESVVSSSCCGPIVSCHSSLRAAGAGPGAATVPLCIWNREAHYRNRVFSTYRFQTGTYQYVPSTDRYRK
jgi:hypothetical protein